MDRQQYDHYAWKLYEGRHRPSFTIPSMIAVTVPRWLLIIVLAWVYLNWQMVKALYAIILFVVLWMMILVVKKISPLAYKKAIDRQCMGMLAARYRVSAGIRSANKIGPGFYTLAQVKEKAMYYEEIESPYPSIRGLTPYGPTDDPILWPYRIEVLMEDDLVHTDEHPVCNDRTCPCQKDRT